MSATREHLGSGPLGDQLAGARRANPDEAGRTDGSGSAGPVALALEAALGMRAPEVHASTPMVRQLAVQICRQLDVGAEDQALADTCARVRDVGMLGLPDSLVRATGPLSPDEWDQVNRHPALGAELLAGLPGMSAAAEVIRAHHERWDGEGYPDGRLGDEIPLLSRVLATADAFVAIATDRPYRKSVGADAALEQVCQEAGSQLDPRAVAALVEVLSGRVASTSTPGRSAGQPGGHRHRDLKSALAEFDLVPAFAPAHERALSLAAGNGDKTGELVVAIESDIGLSIAVLRRARGVGKRRAIANVSDSVARLEHSEIEQTINDVPRAAFPWRTAVEAQLHNVRVHGQAVARAADRIAREVGLEARDDLIAAALLHDVGKLVLLRMRGDGRGVPDERTATPEQRVREERRTSTVDHASLGSLLLERWELPALLVDAVAAHHSAEAEDQLPTFLRLADMIARYAHGDAIDRNVMLELAHTCGLSVPVLREILFDLPHTGGSQRRRATPSPLTRRETAVIRGLAEGKLYKEIARDIGLSTSTVRTHLHNIYAKLGVGDRAQAVLRATEMAWL
jgi:putative nucleotidyltransferase with HDIG domain